MSTAEEANLSEDERRALELIRSEGSVYQSQLWKELDLSSRAGSRIASSLEDADLIERSDAVYNGNTTYELEPVIHDEDLDFSLLMADDMLSPFVGEEDIDPQSDAFSQWVMNLAYEDQG